MTELHELLDRRARSVHPTSGALDDVLRRARRRGRRRRLATGGAIVAVTATLLTGVLDARLPGGPAEALAVRQHLGIFGSTKEAAHAVLVKNNTAQGDVQISLVPLDAAPNTPVSIGEAKDATVSSKGSVCPASCRAWVASIHATGTSRPPATASRSWRRSSTPPLTGSW